MLRINSDGSIPSSNPFFAQATGNNRAIYVMGLRNPFTFDIQPGTGRIFINDVGQNTWEEINDVTAGKNYGWPNAEGNESCANYTCPMQFYGHGGGNTLGCAITGGTFYNPDSAQFPSSYVGDYFYADYCNKWIRRFDVSGNTTTSFATSTTASVVDLKVGPDGALYYLARGANGGVYKIEYTVNASPIITSQPQDKTISVGESASFSVSASGAAPLSYQWERDRVSISGATSSTYSLNNAQLSDSGSLFRCVVTNSGGSATSNEAQLTVTQNTAPTANITLPANGILYSAGDTIDYAGTATDAEDSNILASGFTWQVDLQHDAHTHPFILPTSGAKSGSFVIPTTGHTESNVWYRIYLTVTDSGGLSDTKYVEIFPRKVNVTVATNPTGLQIKLDDQPQTAPDTFVGVVGIIRKLEAVTPQTVNGTKWAFVSWSDGGTVSHNISTPPNDKTYTATFNGLPTVSVTSPANGAVFTEPSSITIKANAADVDGTIARVEFYRGSTFLGEDTTAPYQFVFNNPPTGSYNLKAIATKS